VIREKNLDSFRTGMVVSSHDSSNDPLIAEVS